MKYLIIINDPPYGTERLYNGLRLAHALIKHKHDVLVFLMADAVTAAKTGQKTPDGYYNAERMLRLVINRGRLLLCGTCMDARGLSQPELLEGAQRSTMDILVEETVVADKVLVF